MGAKGSVKLAVVVFPPFAVAAGCADVDLKRLAPPGIVRHENLAKDQPIDPAIKARMEEVASRDAEGFPVLADQPSEAPRGLGSDIRTVQENDLMAKRDALSAASQADRAAADAERLETLEAERDALAAGAAQDAVAIARERRAPIPRNE